MGTVAIGTKRIDRRARSGVIRSFQSIDLFDDLSIRENIAGLEPGIMPRCRAA